MYVTGVKRVFSFIMLPKLCQQLKDYSLYSLRFDAILPPDEVEMFYFRGKKNFFSILT